MKAQKLEFFFTYIRNDWIHAHYIDTIWAIGVCTFRQQWKL